MRCRWFFSTVFVVLFISLVLPQAASSTVLRNLSEEAMTLEAQNIVVGTCTSIRSEWSEDGSKIFTYVTVLPQRSLKGDSGRGEIVIRQLGGEVDEDRVSRCAGYAIPGFPLADSGGHESR